MGCVPSLPVEERAFADLPEDALALFGADAFSTRAWYASTVAAALAQDEVASFQLVRHGERTAAIFPMLRAGRRLSALTTPYTCLWQPLLVPDADLMAIGTTLAPIWRRSGVVRLDCLPAEAAWLPGLVRGLASGGLHALPFEHFGNWHVRVADLDWPAYVDGRPGQLRSAINRQVRRLMKQGATFTLTHDEGGLEDAIAAYETVYAASWKEKEPYPAFNATLMRATAADGTARIGVLRLGGAPIAAQFWLRHGGWAAVLKLAYDETHRALAPGNVLTALMIRQLMEQERVTELDFGRGDDAYKQAWTGQRRSRIGVLVAAPTTQAGALAIARHQAGRLMKKAAATRAAAKPLANVFGYSSSKKDRLLP